MLLRCVIVDDEPAARELLEEYLDGLDDVEIVGSYGDSVEALKAIHTHAPNVVFLDVQMPKLTGVDLLSLIDEQLRPAVVFVTAHEHHALHAIELAAVDYLVKPLREERLREALTRVRGMIDAGLRGVTSGPASGAAYRGQSALQAPAERIGVRIGGTIRLIDVPHIEFVEADGNGVLLHVRGEKHLVRESISTMEQRLPKDVFARVHRKFMVNIREVRELEPLFKGELSARHRMLLTARRFGRARPGSAAGGRVRNRNPSWSPDGTQITFESRRDGVVAIYVINDDGTGEHRLTQDTANNPHPDWSPTGGSSRTTRFEMGSGTSSPFGRTTPMSAA